MRTALILAMLVLSIGAVQGATIIVPDDHPTIQGAIDAAAWGDRIVVRPGTYTENCVIDNKSLILVSEKGPAFTEIDGNRSGNVIAIGGNNSPQVIVSGFTIRNGVASGGGGLNIGLAAKVRVTDNVIRDNFAEWHGGGISCWRTSVEIDGNRIFSNRAGDYCHFHHATGGGIYIDHADARISNNRILDNRADDGGGICVFGGTAVITTNVIAGNKAFSERWSYGCGGGIECEDSSIELYSNVIAENRATSGAGIDFYSLWEMDTSKLINNLVIGHEDNETGITCENVNLTICNTIFWNYSSGTWPAILIREDGYNFSTIVTISHCDIEGGQASVYVQADAELNWGPGNIDADPLLMDAGGGDFHLTRLSPCIDAGDSSAVAENADFEGDPRIAGSAVDIGPDEYYFHLYRNGGVIPGNSLDIRIVGVPGMPVMLGHSPTVQNPPLQTSWGDLHLTMPPLRSWSPGVIPVSGILSLPATVPLSWTTGNVKHFQALVGAQGGSYGKLTNLMSLEVR